MYILQVMTIGYCGFLAGGLLDCFLLTVGVIIPINHSVEAGWLAAKPMLRELLPLLLGPLFYGFVKALGRTTTSIK